MFYLRGEEVAVGPAYVLLTLSGCLIEHVKAATRGPAWYQLYIVGGQEVATAAIAMAKAAGYSTLVVTIDTPVPESRERDLRSGSRELLGDD